MSQNLTFLVVAAMLLMLLVYAWRLWRRGDKPMSQAVSALVTVAILAVIPVWNTTIPIWVWWLTCAVLGLVIGLATWRAVSTRNHTAAGDSVIMER
ncbi:hypothetical protein [Corynebacterium doosanense]|uniref:Uncharacterized protein n=1 Tax=Corynebacterium doosanense CAU 212 = DSM 45436 TaxID=558173 RepID=A0A097IJE4_9CORY|nr:hypothetical protein [Corynebacterium doosanense]AIT62266.1 hypothetical protein CDOO_06125 [Corynebacterium doosanense CAU 212 = DSM 45436]